MDPIEIVELISSPIVKPRRRQQQSLHHSDSQINISPFNRAHSPEFDASKPSISNNTLVFPRSRSSTTILLTNSPSPSRQDDAVPTGDHRAKAVATQEEAPATTSTSTVARAAPDDYDHEAGVRYDRRRQAPPSSKKKRMQMQPEVWPDQQGHHEPPRPPRRQHRRRSALGWPELSTPSLWQCALVEFVGTLFLTFASIAAVIASLRTTSDTPRITVALTQWGLYAVAVILTAPLSGAHLNPSFTLATLLTRHITVVRAVLYAAAQIMGSVFGSLFAKAMIPAAVASEFYLGGCILKQGVVVSSAATGAGALVVVGPDGGQALVAEIFFSFLLISFSYPLFLVAFAPIPGEPPACKGFVQLGGQLARAGILAGLLVAVLIFVSGQLLAPGYTSAGMNPARCFGPAIVEGFPALWQGQWVFWLGPSVAALLFSILYHALFFYRSSSAHAASRPATATATASAGPDMPPATPDKSLPPPTARTSPPPTPTTTLPDPEQQKRMDVFLHIKASLNQKNGEDFAEKSPAQTTGVGIDRARDTRSAMVSLPGTTSRPASSSSMNIVGGPGDVASNEPPLPSPSVSPSPSPSPPPSPSLPPHSNDRSDVPSASTVRDGDPHERQVILEYADLSLRNLMDLPSSSSSTKALLLAEDHSHLDDDHEFSYH